MNVLVLGKGAREHALCWRFAQSSRVSNLFCYPGSDAIGQCAIVPDASSIAEIIKKNKIDIIFPGQDQYLADGVYDIYHGMCDVFGPSQAAAQLESSKYFTKKLAIDAGIPTADFKFFNSLDDLKEHLPKIQYPTVIKQDSLAAGKGVRIIHDISQMRIAMEVLKPPFILEDFIIGEEFSAFYYVRDNVASLLTCARDFKKLLNDDKGPNTGGMGSVSSPNIISDTRDLDKVQEKIINPTMDALSAMDINYTGILYAGLIKNTQGIYLLEYNVRFGDPECQVIMPRMNSDILTMLTDGHYSFNDMSAVGVSLCSRDYPYSTDYVQYPIDIYHDDNINIFHAGTKLIDDTWHTNGGRVMTIVATDENTEKAEQKVYQAIDKISWNGMNYRTDIGFNSI